MSTIVDIWIPADDVERAQVALRSYWPSLELHIDYHPQKGSSFGYRYIRATDRPEITISVGAIEEGRLVDVLRSHGIGVVASRTRLGRGA